MLRYLSHTVSALCYDLAAIHDGRWTYPAETGYNDITEFVFEQLHKMPSFLRGPILIATGVFGIGRLPLEGSLFHKRPAARRRLQIEIWQRSRVGACRDLIRFYNSLVVLALYSRRIDVEPDRPVRE